MKIIEKILSAVMSLIITAGVIVVGAYLLGIHAYVVESGSMEPSIHTGSVCFINEKADYEDTKIGDVIAYSLPNGHYVTHRVVSISKEGMTTKGDANNITDSTVITRNNFIGKNILSIPKVGFLVAAMQTKRGIIISVTVIALFFVAGMLLDSDDEEEETVKKHKKPKQRR